MRLLVILLGLFFERFLMHRLSEKRVLWIHWIQKMFLDICKKNPPFKSRVMKTILMVLPIWLVVTGVYWVLYEDFWGVLAFLLNLAIFYFCIGPMNIFYPKESEGVGIKHLIFANSAIFSPIFWYLLFGPLFLLAYRLIDLASYHKNEQLYCDTIIRWLNWIPARITALCYLLVGHFQKGLEAYGHYFFKSPQDNELLLEKCAQSALTENKDALTELDAEKALEYSMILYLVFISIITIVAWF